MDHLNGSESTIIFFYYRRTIKIWKEISQLRPRGTSSATRNPRLRLCHNFQPNKKFQLEKSETSLALLWLRNFTRCCCIFSHFKRSHAFYHAPRVSANNTNSPQIVCSSHNFGDDHKVSAESTIEFAAVVWQQRKKHCWEWTELGHY